ncbi:MAG: hypothetical protein O2955_09120 [Planctomycetota bacterium]|nr:hypothetical protein [Planctomycetota bacterium]MDA1212668.1 hypothetical protein [Planctomycetota bacterium]
MRYLFDNVGIFAFIISTFACSLSASAQDQSVDRLLRPLPGDANVLAIVRVDEILKSPRAVSEAWETNPEKNILASSGTIPMWIDLLVLSMHVHPGPVDDVTTVAVVPVPEGVSLAQVASREASVTGGPVADIETLVGHQVMKSYRGSYFVELEQGLLGAMRPGVRQDVSRWLRELDTRSAPEISDYLQTSARLPAHIVLAMDLTDLPEPQNVRDRVALILPGNAPLSRIEKLTNLIVGVRGVTLRVSIEQSSPSEIEIEFSDKVIGHSQDILKMFQEILSEHGLALDELEKPKVESKETSIVLSFDMGDESLSHILTLLAGPRPGSIGNVAETTPSRVKIDLVASRKYWNAVNKSLDDLNRAQQRQRSVAKIAGWHDSHAKKIEHLSIEGVDPLLIDYGADVTAKLRALASSLRGVAVEFDNQGRTLTYEVYNDPGSVNFGWGYGFGYRPPTVSFQSNLQEVKEKQAAAISEGEQQRQQIWGMIRDERNRVENELRKKYGADF